MAVVMGPLIFHTPRAVVPRFTVQDEEAGAREPFEDAPLYDFEYRRRRADVTFYRRLVANRMSFENPGPVLDLACGSGRLLVPLLRDGHTVVGVDRSAAMLDACARRVARLSATRRRRCLLLRGDLRRLALKKRFAIALCAFHSIQHLVTDGDLLRFLRAVAKSLTPGGWLAFDVLPPDPDWLTRDPARRWARTTFRHPVTRERLVYTTNHLYDERRRALHMRLYYQRIDERGVPRGKESVMKLCHRQLWPSDVKSLLERAGFALVAGFGGFDGRPLSTEETGPDAIRADEHVYVARAKC